MRALLAEEPPVSQITQAPFAVATSPKPAPASA
jgi:hypothetical protein